jgi:S-adenosylmethionine:tRNA ribosyltransferase-isomerase
MENYQTIYAKHEGAVTPPATGLHFSRELMKRMEIKGITQAFFTLHVGLGNFRTIDVEDLTKHKTDSEEIIIGKEACDIVNKAREGGHTVCAVGTTTMRAIETAVGPGGILKEFTGWTNKFIFPPYEFGVANAFVSNFQAPLSLMLMMQCAFGEYENVMKAYETAIKDGYKFGSFGDALLIVD